MVWQVPTSAPERGDDQPPCVPQPAAPLLAGEGDSRAAPIELTVPESPLLAQPVSFARRRCGQCAACLRPSHKKGCLQPILRPVTRKRRTAGGGSVGVGVGVGAARSAAIRGGAEKRTSTQRCGQCRPCRVPTLRKPCALLAAIRSGLPWAASAKKRPRQPESKWTTRPADDLMVRGLLDPSSNCLARPNIPAEALYTAAQDGLEMANSWSQRYVYLNPPFDSALQWRFINRAIDEVESGRCPGAIILCRGSPDTNW